MSRRICSVADCYKTHYALGLCEMHYRRWLRYERLERVRPSYTTACSVDGCDRISVTRGMCRPHYLQAWRRGLLSTAPCTEDSCDRPAVMKGLCWTHYIREYKVKRYEKKGERP